ncbi:MAG TPA: potassium channel family protein [Streptosporangiaceae bacterium]|nr:potassium channel family protein [Streptosporangiaceae bacterium]
MRRPVPAPGTLTGRESAREASRGAQGEEAATVTRRRGRLARGGSGGPGPSGRYGLLLILLIAGYVLSAIVASTWIDIVQLGLFVATALLTLRSSRLPRRRAQLIAVVLVTGSVAAGALALTRPSPGAVAAASIWTGVLLLVTVAVIVKRILSFATVTGQSIFGAISAYLIVGFMFAAFYAAIGQLDGGHFFASGQPGNAGTFQYFSFTTLTTLGYGDFTAAANDGRAIAVIEALTGQVFLATLVARLVAAFRGPRAPAAGSSGGSGGSAGPARGRPPAARRGTGGARAGRRPRWRRPPPGR